MNTRMWTKTEIAEVERLATNGLSIKQVADKVGASYVQVNYLRKKLNISFVVRRRDYRDNSQYDANIRERWETLLPELKANLLRDIANYS